MKSERLKKLEAELHDLEQWMKLGLVPKKEIERHEEEIRNLKARIGEEKERLQFLKESGEMEEYTAPRRVPAKTVYPDTPSMSDIDIGEENNESTLEIETETMEMETNTSTGEKEEEEEEVVEEETEDDPFSDRNRWKRGGIIDPDANDW